VWGVGGGGGGVGGGGLERVGGGEGWGVSKASTSFADWHQKDKLGAKRKLKKRFGCGGTSRKAKKTLTFWDRLRGVTCVMGDSKRAPGECFGEGGDTDTTNGAEGGGCRKTWPHQKD